LADILQIEGFRIYQPAPVDSEECHQRKTNFHPKVSKPAKESNYNVEGSYPVVPIVTYSTVQNEIKQTNPKESNKSIKK
jgi:hypothetical protein